MSAKLGFARLLAKGGRWLSCLAAPSPEAKLLCKGQSFVPSKLRAWAGLALASHKSFYVAEFLSRTSPPAPSPRARRSQALLWGSGGWSCCFPSPISHRLRRLLFVSEAGVRGRRKRMKSSYRATSLVRVSSQWMEALLGTDPCPWGWEKAQALGCWPAFPGQVPETSAIFRLLTSLVSQLQTVKQEINTVMSPPPRLPGPESPAQHALEPNQGLGNEQQPELGSSCTFSSTNTRQPPAIPVLGPHPAQPMRLCPALQPLQLL